MNATVKEQRQWWLGLILAFAGCAIYAALISFQTMPISEGWYTEYAWQINHGALPYKDFEYLFFPLYMYIIAGFTRIFGYSIIALRILGIFVFGGMGSVLYCIFSRIFDNLSALLGAVIAMLFAQSQVGQCFYDYIQFHDLFAMITAYFLLRISLENKDKKGKISGKQVTLRCIDTVMPIMLMLAAITGLRGNVFQDHPVRMAGIVCLFLCGLCMLLLFAWIKKKHKGIQETVYSASINALLCGVFVSAECMVKQSNGVLMIVFVCGYLLYCAVTMKNTGFLRSFFGVVSGIAIAFSILLIYLFATNSFSEFMQCCFGNALLAKGGVGRVLFRWIPGVAALLWNDREKVIIIGLFLYIMIEKYIRKAMPDRKSYPVRFLLLCGAALALVDIVFVKNNYFASLGSRYYYTDLPVIVYAVCIIMFLAYAIYMLFSWIGKFPWGEFEEEGFALFPVLGVIFTQGWGSGMSGGLAVCQTSIAMGGVIALCLHVTLRARNKLIAAGIMLFSLSLGGTFIGRKTIQTYDWWGLLQGELALHTEEADVPLLRGLRMRTIDKECYETVYRDVTANTKKGDSIFVFPHSPIFYTMTDRHSITYSKVQWFDVSSANAVLRDIETLRNTPPAMIVYVVLPEGVYVGHETSFNTWQTRVMKDFLIKELIPVNGYQILHEIDIGNGYSVVTYMLPDKDAAGDKIQERKRIGNEEIYSYSGNFGEMFCCRGVGKRGSFLGDDASYAMCQY